MAQALMEILDPQHRRGQGERPGGKASHRAVRKRRDAPHPQGEALEACAMGALARLLRAQPAVLTGLLADGALVHCLEAFLPHLDGLLEGILGTVAKGKTHTRAKALLCLGCATRRDVRWLSRGIQLKLTPCLDRVARETDPRLRACLDFFTRTVEAKLPQVTKAILKGLSKGPSDGKPPAAQATLVLHVVTSTALQSKVVTAPVLEDLAASLLRIAAEGRLPERGDCERLLLLVVEAISQLDTVLLAHQASVLGALMPALLDLAVQSSDHETASLYWKILGDIHAQLLPYLPHPEARGSPAAALGAEDFRLPESAAEALCHLLEDKLLPHAAALLDCEPPIPAYTLKLLGGSIVWQPTLSRAVLQAGLLPLCVSFFDLDSENNNKHNLRLLVGLASNLQQVPTTAILATGLPEQLDGVLAYAVANHVEAFYELLLDLLGALLQRVEEGGEHAEALRRRLPLQHLDAANALVGHSDAAVAEKAATAVATAIALRRRAA